MKAAALTDAHVSYKKVQYRVGGTDGVRIEILAN